MTTVKREQFELEKDGLRVRHKQTGATFSTYLYDNPKDFRITVENSGRTGERLANEEEYEYAEVKALADTILRERALGPK